MAANKGNITKRVDIDRALTHAEGDTNFQELINIIDDYQNFEISQQQTNSDLSSLASSASSELQDHLASDNPHPVLSNQIDSLSTELDNVFTSDGGIGNWVSDRSYSDGAIVIRNGVLYQLENGGDSSVDPETDNQTNWVPVVFGGVTETRIEPVVLSAGQTRVELQSVNTNGMALYVEGVREFNYTIIDSTTFDLPQEFAEGTNIWVISGESDSSIDNSNLIVESDNGTIKTLGEWASNIEHVEESEVISAGTSVSRKLEDRFSDFVSYQDYGITGDGSTNDTNAFSALEDDVSGDDIELHGRSFVVDEIPTGNLYRNAVWIVDGEELGMSEYGGVITGKVTTGALEPAYTGGVNDTPTVDGRTNENLRAIMASQNCRADFARSACIASIYSWAYGNVSGNFASRQSIAGAPQTVNIGSEEGQALGFQSGNYTTQFCRAEGSSTYNVGSDDCVASGAHSGTISSLTSYAGRGHDFRGTPVFDGNGTLTDVIIDNPGAGYITPNDNMYLQVRQYGSDTDADLSYTTDGNGGVTSITINDGGSGYRGIVDVRIDSFGDYSTIIASARSKVENQFGVVLASDEARVRGRESAVIASDTCVVNDDNSVVIGSTSCTSNGDRNGIYSSAGSEASADGSVVLGGVNSKASNIGAIVMGRGVDSEFDRSLVYGDGGAGASSSTSNRKFQVTQSGNVTAAGSITGSTGYTDYAEYFENLETGTIPLGTIVALEGRKVRPAIKGDEILGVVSATAIIVAGDSPFQWSGRYMTGEFGEALYEDVEMVKWENESGSYDGSVSGATDIPDDAKFYTESRPVENPDYDDTIPNVPRSQRPDEWSCIGLIGQLHVRVGKGVKVGDKISADGNSSSAGMQCMEIKSEYDESKGYGVALCLLK